MDAGLFIAVNKGTLIPHSATWVKTVTWAGVTSEDDDSRVYLYGNSQMQPSLMSDWLMKMLPMDFQLAGLDSYLVHDSSVTRLESDVNGVELDSPSTLPEWLLALLRCSDRWLLAFLWHWDEMNDIQCSNAEDAVEKLRSVLHWNGQRHGFCRYSAAK